VQTGKRASSSLLPLPKDGYVLTFSFLIHNMQLSCMILEDKKTTKKTGDICPFIQDPAANTQGIKKWNKVQSTLRTNTDIRSHSPVCGEEHAERDTYHSERDKNNGSC
jgi:hypothetical protein